MSQVHYTETELTQADTNRTSLLGEYNNLDNQDASNIDKADTLKGPAQMSNCNPDITKKDTNSPSFHLFKKLSTSKKILLK